MRSQRLLCTTVIFLAMSLSRVAHASTFDAGSFTNLTAIFTSKGASDFMNAFGAWGAHREFEGASTGVGRLGIDAGVEVTLIRLPDELIQDLVSAGLSNSSDLATSLPVARIHLRKSLGSSVEVSLSGLIYQNIRL